MPKMLDFEWRTPIQPRARRTIADMFEATAQLLDTAAPERLTTNHVAARADYSIGTLYRYFPSKWALLRAMASQEIHSQQAKALAAIEGMTSPVRTEAIVRILIRVALRPFAGRYRVHAGVMRLLATNSDPLLSEDVPAVVLSERMKAAMFAAPSEVWLNFSNEKQFTMIHAVIGTVEAALRSQPELVASRDFEDQLVGLVLHFSNADERCN